MYGYMDPVIPCDAITAGGIDFMLRLKAETGIHRFLQIGITNTVRLTGYADDAVYYEFAERLLKIKEEAARHDIEVGWWSLPSLKTGNSCFQHIVDITGRVSPISTCPLDADFAADFARRCAIVARIVRPKMMLLEDDYQLSNHPGFRLGCFCPAHLKRFAGYAGREYSREELNELFSAFPMKAQELRRRWAKMSHDTMLEFSRTLRESINAVSPETRIWLCEPCTTDLDGGLSRDIPEVLAGEGNNPAIRIFGTQYGSQDVGREIPANLSHTMYSAEHLPDNFELFHESDTYPHNRFFSSAALMESIMTGAMMIGCDSSLMIGGQYLDDPLEEFGYFAMYKNCVKRWRALQEALRGGELAGCQIPYRHEFEELFARPSWEPGGAIYGLRAWVQFMGRFGFPYSTREKKVKLLTRAFADAMDDRELTAVLAGAALLDSGAAAAVQERGLSRLMGVKVTTGDPIPAVEELILPAAGVPEIRGKLMYNFAYAPSGSEAAEYAKLELDGAEMLTSYRGPGQRVLQPGLTRFVNELGGRVAVMGCSVSNNSSNLYNYRKKAILARLLEWLNGEPLDAVIRNAPNAWMLFNKNEERAIMMVTNLSPDEIECPAIALAPKWQHCSVAELDESGEWKPSEARVEEGTLRLPGPARYLKPRIFRFA